MDRRGPSWGGGGSGGARGLHQELQAAHQRAGALEEALVKDSGDGGSVRGPGPTCYSRLDPIASFKHK